MVLGLVRAIGLAAVVAATACVATPEDDSGESAEAAATSDGALPSDPRATPATRTVLANLHAFDFHSADPFDHRVLVGQQEADVSNRSQNGTTLLTPDMQKVTGKSPGLVSYELSHAYKGARTMFDADAFRAGAGALRELVIDKHDEGVLVSFVWHLRCPKERVTDNDKFSAADCPRDYTMSELLARKGNGREGAHFTEWRAMLDALADFLWSLKDDQGELIPVQIRPFHEFTGDWFWWGKGDADVYAAAWREMVTYLRDGRGLHNVLWVFCPAAPSGSRAFEAFYPGDAYADVIAFDEYDFDNGSFDRSYASNLRQVGAFARAHGKAAAVGEIGRDLLHQSVDPNWFNRSMLAPLKSHGFAYVALWRNAPWEKFVPEVGDGETAADLRRMAADDATLFAGQHNLYAPLHVRPSS